MACWGWSVILVDLWITEFCISVVWRLCFQHLLVTRMASGLKNSTPIIPSWNSILPSTPLLSLITFRFSRLILHRSRTNGERERESNVDNWLTQVLPKGGPFNWCVCVWLCVCGLVVTVWEPDVIWFPLQNAYWRRLNVLRLLQCSAGHVLQAAQGALSWTSQGTKGIYRCYILSMLCVLLLC